MLDTFRSSTTHFGIGTSSVICALNVMLDRFVWKSAQHPHSNWSASMKNVRRVCNVDRRLGRTDRRD